MKKLILKISLFIPFLIITIFTVETFLNNKLSKNSYYAIDISKHILILGHSHSASSLNDTLIENTINLSSSGEPYFYTYYKLKKVIEANSNIDTVLLEYTNNYFFKSMDKRIYSEAELGWFYPKYSQINFI